MTLAIEVRGPWKRRRLARQVVALGIASSDRARTETLRERAGFDRVKKAERAYASSLKKLADHIGQLAGAFDPADPSAMTMLQALLDRYSETIRPWAIVTAQRMLVDVSRRDEAVWNELARDMSRALRKEIKEAPTGELLRAFLAEQVDLITSLPRDAAQRVHKLTLEGLGNATRAREISAEILRTGEVTKSRAMLIARTEVSRTASALVQARATYVGSDGYIWRTAEDSDVRPALSLPAKQRANFVGSHRKLNGKFIRWDAPPVSGQRGERAHAGMIYNCRCYPDPVIPRDLM